MNPCAVIVAGGSGSRMQSDLPKQFLPLEGKPVLIHTVLRFLAFDPQLPIVLVLPQAHLTFWEQLAPRHLSSQQLNQVSLSPGGTTRSDSVQAGLELMAAQVKVPEKCWVAIHDGVRPFVLPEMIQQAFDVAENKGASVACVPVKFSLRQRMEGGKSQPVDRAHFFEVQTPQTFRLDQILECYRLRPPGSFTDDASLYQLKGGQVSICEGSYDNIKLTTPEDLAIGHAILKRQALNEKN